MGVTIKEYTYSSLVDAAINRERYNSNSNSSRNGRESFTQTKTFDEAVEFAKNGWDLGLEKFELEGGVISTGNSFLTPSLAGALPHVQNYILGYPEQMYQISDLREYNLPRMELFVNLAYVGSTNSEDVLEFSISIVSYINRLSAKYNIKLTGFFGSNQGSGGRWLDLVTLKNYDESLVINNLAFAFHPSFFRRIWFGVVEARQGLSGGYGRVLGDDEVLDVIKDKIDLYSEKVQLFRGLTPGGRFSFTYEDSSNMIVYEK